MGYDVRITRERSDGWPDILLGDWLAYLNSDPSMRPADYAELKVSGGKTLRIKGEGLAVWAGHSCVKQVWFDFRDGTIAVKAPDSETLKKMWAIAHALGADVQGDEGETYDSDGCVRELPKDDAQPQVQTEPRKVYLQFVFEPSQVQPVDLLRRAAAVLEHRGVATANFPFRNRTVDLGADSDVMRLGMKRAFALEREDIDLRFVRGGSHRLEFLRIELAQRHLENLDEWATPFVEDPAFVMGWASDLDYHYWQNAQDPIEYEAAGREYAHLLMKRRDLPRPLNDLEIDTSDNPCRYILREGYIECIGALMWLGRSFWRIGVASIDELQRTSWLRVARLSQNTVRLEVPGGLFVSAEGESGRLQRELRLLLFPRKA